MTVEGGVEVVTGVEEDPVLSLGADGGGVLPDGVGAGGGGLFESGRFRVDEDPDPITMAVEDEFQMTSLPSPTASKR